MCGLLLVSSIPQMLTVQPEPPLHTTFPSIHAFVMLEGTMNLTGEMQPLVEQLMMIKRMQVSWGPRSNNPVPLKGRLPINRGLSEWHFVQTCYSVSIILV